MSEDLSPVRVQLKLEHLLWRTRGRHWDYLFLVEPHARYGQGWYSLHKEVFADSEPRPEGECYVLGELLDEQSRQRMVFVGTAFLDDHRRDAFGRPVAHYMVWLHPDKDLHEVKKNLPQSWGHAVLSHVGYALDADEVLSTASEDDSEIRHAFERVLAATNWTIELEGSKVDPTEYRDIGVIRKKARNIINPASSPPSGGSERYLVHSSDSPHFGVASSEGDWEAEVNHAITQGEAWALLQDQGSLVQRFPTPALLRQKINMDHGEVLRRLTESFNGSWDDKFIQVQAESLIVRVMKRQLPELSRGFDAVVDTFVRHGRHLNLSRLMEDKAYVLLVQQIGHGAATTDIFIRNVYTRLCSQAKNQSLPKDISNTDAVQEDKDDP